MKRLLTIFIFALAAQLCAQETAVEAAVRFRVVDIFVDSKTAPLAAYQVEFSAANGNAKIVGIEGGDSVFSDAPFYDPKAMQHERVIIAAFSTESAEKLPTGKTRVATIHLQTRSDVELDFVVKLHIAANSIGKKISPLITAEERKLK